MANKQHFLTYLLFCIVFLVLCLGEAYSIAVLRSHCGPLSPGLIPGPRAVFQFGSQSKLASAGFSLGTPVFLLQLKLDLYLDYNLFLFVQRAYLENSACSMGNATLFKDAKLFFLLLKTGNR